MATALNVLNEVTGGAVIRKRLPADTEEGRLVTAAKLGNHAAFEELCARHTGRLKGTLYRITRSHEDAEDALQDCWLRAYLRIGSFDGRSSFLTWLTRIAINSGLMLLRKRRSNRELPMVLPVARGEAASVWDFEDEAPNPESRYTQREAEEILHGAIRTLRPKVRRVVEMSQLQEHSLKATADALGISVIAAKARLFHGRAALRKSIARWRRLKKPVLSISGMNEKRGAWGSGARVSRPEAKAVV